MEANLVSIVFVTGLGLILSLARPGTKQPQRRVPVPPGVKALKDLKYGKAMLLDLGHSLWNIPNTMNVSRAAPTGMLWLSIAVIWLLPSSTISARPSPSRKPNILIILTDDQGRGDYSAFGTRDIHTPNMDRLFHEGMTFQNFFANSCVCSPSRAALLTGCYPDSGRAGQHLTVLRFLPMAPRFSTF